MHIELSLVGTNHVKFCRDSTTFQFTYQMTLNILFASILKLVTNTQNQSLLKNRWNSQPESLYPTDELQVNSIFYLKLSVFTMRKKAISKVIMARSQQFPLRNLVFRL